MKVFCDDGSTAVKLAYLSGEDKLKINTTINSFGIGWLVNPLDSEVFNFEIGSMRYSYSIANDRALQTTNIEYQYSDANLLAVHYALLKSGLEHQDIDLIVTLPITEFYNPDSTKNTFNIEKKKQNLLRDIELKNGKLFNIKSVMVMPESLPAAYPRLTGNADISEYETSVVVDLGGTTLDCGAIAGAYDAITKISGDSSIGVNMITEPTLLALKAAGTITSPAIANKLIENLNNEELFNKLVVEREKIPMVREEIKKAIEQVAALVIAHLQRYKSVHRIFLTGGGALLIEPYIKKAYANLGDRVICLENPQVALVTAMAIIDRG